jgi:alpha-glucosidase
VADEFGERLMIGEAYLPIDRLMAYYGVDLRGFHLPFNFHLISTPWEAAAIGALIKQYEAALPQGGWPNWVVGNHDRSRVASRLGLQQARVAAMLLLTLRGTPTIYQGEELAMQDVSIAPDQVRDPWEKNVPGLGLGRDPVRTPIPWTSEVHGGFTNGHPWLPVDAVRTKDVAQQRADSASMLRLYQELLRLRRSESALSLGSYSTLGITASLLVYERRYKNRRLQIALNMTGASASLPTELSMGKVLLSTLPGERSVVGTDRVLRPNEGVVSDPDIRSRSGQ